MSNRKSRKASPESDSHSGLSRTAGGAAAATAAAAAGAAATAALIASLAARRVVVPQHSPEEDLRIFGFDPGSEGARDPSVRLARTADSELGGIPGEYSLWFSGGDGHAVVGEILDEDEESVTRRVIRVGFGDLSQARKGRINGWLWLSPADAGLASTPVIVNGPVGPNPGWFIPAEQDTDLWAIHIHGRGSRRAETLRSVLSVRERGLSSLVVSYRNDGEAARSADGRYALGDTEWRDVDAAIGYALDHGARRVILVGWSMGGAMALQAAARSEYRESIAGLVLDSPVVDWTDALHYQGEASGLVYPLRRLVLKLVGSRAGRYVTGQDKPIEFDRLDWLEHAGDLTVPVLLLHSDDDGYVPSGPSRELAAQRPDLVTLVAFSGARHCKLWNYDRAKWESALDAWLPGIE